METIILLTINKYSLTIKQQTKKHKQQSNPKPTKHLQLVQQSIQNKSTYT